MDSIIKYIEDGKINASLFQNNDEVIKFIEELANLTNIEFQDIFEIKATTENKNYIYKDILSFFNSEEKKYHHLRLLSRNFWYLPVDVENEFRDVFDLVLESNSFSNVQKGQIKSIILSTHTNRFEYKEAKGIIDSILEDELSFPLIFNISEFYVKTREYDLAYEYISKIESNGYDEGFKARVEKVKEEIELKKLGKKKHYLPKDEVNQIKLWEYLNITPPVKEPKEKKSYDNLDLNFSYKKMTEELYDINIDSYVAYDIETTGLSSTKNEIIEIGAVKVINGVVEEEGKFVFQKLIKPKAKYLPQRITEITGIDYSMLENQEYIEKILPEFLDFVGDLPLVGYNIKSFDNKFLEVSMGKCGIEKSIKFFDLLCYVRKIKSYLNIEKCNLSCVATCFNIENKFAHRALSDALTTAKIMERLKMDY